MDRTPDRTRLLSLDVEADAAQDDARQLAHAATLRSRSKEHTIAFPPVVNLEGEPFNAEHNKEVTQDGLPDALNPDKETPLGMSPNLASPRLRPKRIASKEDGAEFTFRGVITGSLIGGVVCLSNIYFGFKTSLTLGSSFTGAILGFAALATAKGFNRRENCALTSACNAAGGFAAGYITAIPALKWFGKEFTFVQLFLWTLAAGFLGVFLMPPLRRHMILVQELTFPSGTATAVVISRLHQAREDGLRKAKALLYAMAAGFCYVIFTYFVPVLYNVPLFMAFKLPAAQSAGFYVMASPALMGSGVFTGLKNCLCMCFAAFVAYGLVGPLWVCRGSNDPSLAYVSGCIDGGLMYNPSNPVTFRGPTMPLMQEWFLWVSIAILFADQVVGICLQYKSILSAFKWRVGKDELEIAEPDQLIKPIWWISGMIVSSVMCVFVVTFYFDMRWWEVVVAIVFGIPLSIICIQCTGETDTTPTGAVGKMSQLLFAILTPHMAVPNLMAANIAAAGATQSTDIMQSFKTGHLLKASPKAQFFGSIIGCTIGVGASMAGWYLFRDLIPACAPPTCQSDEFPAQAAQIWYSAAKVLSTGIKALPHGVLPYAICGLVYGTISAFLNRFLPAKHKKYLPSAIALSLGLLLGPYLPMAMLTGCLIFMAWEKKYPEQYEDKGVPIASGMVAGEGMAGIVQGVFGLAGITQGALTTAGCFGYPC